ncbi:MAG: M20/M25/M40 family metallo-hydrolase [Mycobacteriales bacterium]
MTVLDPAPPAAVPLSGAELELLTALLRLPTAGPLEVGPGAPVELWAAQREYARAAAELGFTVLRHAAPRPEELPGLTPRVVRDALAADPGFLAAQPSLVLRLGPPAPPVTVMFNVHLDTVAGLEPVRVDGGRVYGRGATDAKGPAVALLAGVRSALTTGPSAPAVATELAVLVQAVAGEEGGALGVFGTRPLVELGFTGDLNVFCEPTGRRLLDRCTASMTACVRVDGEDAIDDEPAAGHNASVLLGALAGHLAETLPTVLAGGDGQVCVAGLHTGSLHNRVYGSGRLLLNLSYGCAATADRLAAAVDREVRAGLAVFAERYAGSSLLARTAADAAAVTSVEWLKRDLPALAPAEPARAAADRLAAAAGLARWPAGRPAFTCDAIWAGRSGALTVLLGPGDLAGNHAHAAGEFAELAELERFAADVARLLGVLARRPELVGERHGRESG